MCPRGNSGAANLTATEIYSNNFESTVGNEWRNGQTNQIPITSVTPVGGRRFLGEFGNNDIRLTLNNLPAHNRVSVVFDLYVIGSWDGNNTTSGLNLFEFSYDGQRIIRTNFRNIASPADLGTQAFPDDYPIGQYLGRTGASENNTLGFPGDSVYQISRAFSHSSGTLQLNFSGNGLEELSNEVGELITSA